jgi:PAS domain S-box-containing protein
MILTRFVCVVALLGYLILLILVAKDVRRKEVRSFAMYLVAMLVWQVGATGVSFTTNAEVALFFYGVIFGLGSSVALFYAQFVRDFLGVRSKKWIIQFGYVWFVAAAVWTFSGGPYVIVGIYQSAESSLLVPTFGTLFYAVSLIAYSYFGYSAALLLGHHAKATSPAVRNRIKYLLTGLALVFLGSAANFTALKPYPVDIVCNAVNAFLIAYAILRYQLLDISVVLRKGLVYSLLTAIVALVYFLGVFLALNLFHVLMGYQIFLLSLVLAAVTAVAMQPLRDMLQAWLDKLFFREKYDAGRMLKRLSRTAASVLQLDKLTAMILDDVLSTMHISRGAFYIKDEKGGDYRLRAYKDSDPMPAGLSIIRPDSPIIAWLSNHQAALLSHALETDPSFIGLWTRERDDLKQVKAELFVPLVAAGNLIGVLMLGPKLSEQPYTSGEELTLDTLANQTAVAIANARLFSETLAEKERTATIVEQAFAGIILLDCDLKIVGLNPATEAIIDCTQAQVMGMPLRAVLGEGILDEKSSLRKAMATGERVAPREEVLNFADRRRDVLLGVAPLRDGYLLSLADITQLKEVDRLKSDIVANVSHEFRTPLAIIKAYAELLMDDQQGERAESRHEYLSIIDAETDRLASMVSGLLDLARLEAGRGAVIMAPTNLGEVVTEVVKMLQTQARLHNLVLNIDVSRDLPLLRANRELLVTIIRNLLGNAVKFSPDGGRVDVSVRQQGNSVIFKVADQGIGISEDDMPHLFEKFYRGAAAKAAGIRGTGLGLVLTKQAVEVHGGTISVVSQLGQGTCFTLILPADGVAPAPQGGLPAGEKRPRAARAQAAAAGAAAKTGVQPASSDPQRREPVAVEK